MALLHGAMVALVHVIVGTIFVGVLDRNREIDYQWTVREVLFVVFGWPLLLLIDILVKIEHSLGRRRRLYLLKRKVQGNSATIKNSHSRLNNI